MNKIPIANHTFHPPRRICIEASWLVIAQADLDAFSNEIFDYINGVVEIEVVGDQVTFESVRTYEAFRAGEPNAGRGRLTFNRNQLEAIYV